jgi:hypothetical protein
LHETLETCFGGGLDRRQALLGNVQHVTGAFFQPAHLAR